MPWDLWDEMKEKIYQRAETCRYHISTHRDMNAVVNILRLRRNKNE